MKIIESRNIQEIDSIFSNMEEEMKNVRSVWKENVKMMRSEVELKDLELTVLKDLVKEMKNKLHSKIEKDYENEELKRRLKELEDKNMELKIERKE